jgi:hypothetical protein
MTTDQDSKDYEERLGLEDTVVSDRPAASVATEPPVAGPTERDINLEDILGPEPKPEDCTCSEKGKPPEEHYTSCPIGDYELRSSSIGMDPNYRCLMERALDGEDVIPLVNKLRSAVGLEPVWPEPGSFHPSFPEEDKDPYNELEKKIDELLVSWSTNEVWKVENLLQSHTGEMQSVVWAWYKRTRAAKEGSGGR